MTLPSESRHIAALSDSSQFESLLRGSALYGRTEPRIAFLGRSNVGKSSLLNLLLGKKLARISKQPGKTREIHFYLWHRSRKILADLPGYGYARASHEERNRWSKFIQMYLEGDERMEIAVVLLDSRHGPTEQDCDAIRFFQGIGTPLLFVFTKIDQLKTQAERARRKKEGQQALLELGYSDSQIFWTSTQDAQSIRNSDLQKLQDALCRDYSSLIRVQ